jgi:hypothetical protein
LGSKGEGETGRKGVGEKEEALNMLNHLPHSSTPFLPYSLSPYFFTA